MNDSSSHVVKGSMYNNPTKIIGECVDRYANFWSYQDRGVVFTRHSDESESDPRQITFYTLFTKPDLFRFEYISPHPYPPLKHISTRYVCGFDGDRAYTLRQRHEEHAVVEIEESLNHAIARSVGTSCGSVHNIAKLLFPNIEGFSLSDLTHLKLVGEIEVEEEPCCEIAGVHKKFGPTSVWVSISDFTILKYSNIVRNFRNEELRSQITLNKKIERDLFKLEPMKK